MDVSIRLSLKGGHQWEFVCDEDDPMVFGLISALPGANLDASLPSDGLIQVEARNGQRFFLSRASLVAFDNHSVAGPSNRHGSPARRWLIHANAICNARECFRSGHHG